MTVLLKSKTNVNIQFLQYLLLIIPRGKALLEYSFCDKLYIAWGLYTRDIATQDPHSPGMGNSMLRENPSESNILGLW